MTWTPRKLRLFRTLRLAMGFLLLFIGVVQLAGGAWVSAAVDLALGIFLVTPQAWRSFLQRADQDPDR